MSSGLKTTQFSALAVINRLGPITIAALAEAMEIERTSLTRNLGLLQPDGVPENLQAWYAVAPLLADLPDERQQAQDPQPTRFSVRIIL